jgi:hypothetical protein
LHADHPLRWPTFARRSTTMVMRSRVLGCELQVISSNNLTSIGIAEAVLGSVESLLATSFSHKILPNIDRLKLRVLPSEAM